jgi:L-2-hydroxycarboxylate dehydrogenase (NAD+)
MLPAGCAVDEQGNETCDPNRVAALLPFGQHKGYGLALIDELFAAFIGGSLPTLRSRWKQGPADEKRAPCFFFQCMRPDAIDCDDFAQGRTQSKNVAAVVADIRGHGNDRALLPGQLEHEAAELSRKHGGLLFTAAEIAAFAEIAQEAGVRFDGKRFRSVDVG